MPYLPIGNYLAQQLCELGSVLSLFISCLLIIHAYLGIALSEGNPCHCKIHTYLGAFSVEIIAEILDNIFADALCNAYNMLGSPGLFPALSGKLLSGCVADRALSRGLISFVNITAYSFRLFGMRLCHGSEDGQY